MLRSEIQPQASTPKTLTAGDGSKLWTNEGAASEIIFDLPVPVAGLEYRFLVQDVDGLRIVPDATSTIRVAAATTTASTGYISSTTIGNVVQIVAINTTQWIVVNQVGTWTVV